MELYQLYQKLIDIRKEEKALQSGALRFHSSEKLFVMTRSLETESILVLINQTNEEQEYSLHDIGACRAEELLSGVTWEEVKDGFVIKIPAMSSSYVKLSQL